MSPSSQRRALAAVGVLSLLLTLPWLLRLGAGSASQNSAVSPAFGVESGPVDAYGEVIDRLLEPGVIVYDPAERMRVGQAQRVEVRIALEFSDEILEGLRTSGQPEIEELPVGALMRAELRGDRFEITPICSETQPLRSNGFRQWCWSVTPTASGLHYLWLTVSALYEDQTRVIDTVPFEREIQVAVNPVYTTGRWLSANWDGLLGALGITGASVVSLLYSKLRRRGSKEPAVE
ncbi:MAG: hypothetical protein ACRD0K_14275 [Egibacteraceae bacterium]